MGKNHSLTLGDHQDRKSKPYQQKLNPIDSLTDSEVGKYSLPVLRLQEGNDLKLSDDQQLLRVPEENNHVWQINRKDP